jgi:hypothetical protein
MPRVIKSYEFELDADQHAPAHSEGWPHASAAEADKYHIEKYDLESGEASLIAINLEDAADACTMLNAAIKRARNSSPFSMTDMNGYAVVGPGMEGQGDSAMTVGVAWRMRNGDELPEQMVATLARFA